LSFLGNHSSSNSRIDQVLFSKFEHFHRLLMADRGKVVEKIRQRIAVLEVVEQVFSRTRVPAKTGVPCMTSAEVSITVRSVMAVDPSQL